MWLDTRLVQLAFQDRRHWLFVHHFHLLVVCLDCYIGLRPVCADDSLHDLHVILVRAKHGSQIVRCDDYAFDRVFHDNDRAFPVVGLRRSHLELLFIQLLQWDFSRLQRLSTVVSQEQNGMRRLRVDVPVYHSDVVEEFGLGVIRECLLLVLNRVVGPDHDLRLSADFP